ncbi:MAG: sucrose-phosphate phosphatase [Acaryochloridaceae cyanobacterium SU_2_1]|nr:sucrose-phosphate phosphatase [Acaryochloridaceae cyanobacterium SU_2_1]
MTRFLLVTDLDNTLVGDQAALERLNQQLMQLRQEQDILLAYSTGRSHDSYLKLKATEPLLDPDALVTSVGTEIYYQNSRTPDPDWSRTLDNGWVREDILAITAHFQDLVLQPASEQRPYKVSFYLAPHLASDLVPRLKVALHIRGLDTKIVYSGGKDLDILPLGGDKGQALLFLREQFDISAEQTIVCGDSGNDQALFSVGKERGVVVGNAQPELLQWYKEHGADYHYLATRSCAAGILEGLHHFRLLS